MEFCGMKKGIIGCSLDVNKNLQLSRCLRGRKIFR